MAFDKSVRRIDVDGRMHVEISNISKATVNPYLGSEIPNCEGLGLQPDKIYQLLRDPEELKKATQSFVNLPVLSEHVPVTADEPRQDLVVGSTGSDVAFDGTYLTSSLSIWDARAIAGIESREQTELSSAYRYTPDMTAGEFEGVKYDGVMRDIIGNHVALVDVGRAGRDVVVSDRNPFLNKETEMKKRKLSATAQSRVNAVISHIKPQIAQDAELSELTELLTALAGTSTEETPPAMDDDEDAANDGAGSAQALEFLAGKLSDEDLASVTSMLSGDAPAAADEGVDDDKPAVPVPPKDDDDDKKPAMDAAMVEKIASDRVAIAIAARDALHEARIAVEPLVGKVALDSAAAVYKFALDHAGVETKGVHPSAYGTLVGMVKARESKQSLGMDSAAATKVAAQFTDLSRFN